MNDLELIHKYLPKDKWEDAKDKLKLGYPVQYIIGNVDFYNNLIKVDERSLIPRFETEHLVEKTLSLLKKMNIETKDILEIGTGTGAISISLKKNINSNIDAIDISSDAIDLAKENALLNNVDINYRVCDIHEFNSSKKYDLIISNPPYVPYDGCVDEKIKYEPESAIFAKDDGIYFYKVILNKIYNNLKDDYLIAFEIGDNEGNRIKDIVKTILPNSYILLEKDLNNYERYLFITNKKEIFK